jgi:site-specific recombinase XerD
VPAREGVWQRVHAGKVERDRLLLALFADGLRGSELLPLDWDDAQEVLGRKNLDSTQRYTPVSAHQLRGAVRRLRFAPPR